MNKHHEAHIVGNYIDRNYKLIKSRFDRAFQDLGLDITTDQWMLLDALHVHKVLSQNELSTLCYKDTTTVSRIIDLLCDKNYVIRSINKEDRRRYDVSLTEKGENIIDRSEDQVRYLRDCIWNDLTDDDYQDFLRIMNRIYKNLTEK